MTNFEKIDKVLDIILNCQTPPRISSDEIAEELKKKKLDITTNELIGILFKLEKDDFIKAEINETNKIMYYFSTFGGRFFRDSGGYKSQNKSNKRKRIQERFMIAMNFINIFAIIILTFLNYRATDKANDNKEEVKTLNSKIERLTKTKDSLVYIMNLNEKRNFKKHD